MSNRRVKAIKVAFAEGARYSIDIEAATKSLKATYEQNGVLTPPAVVESARPEEAPLHPVFEWRDDVAAEKFRIWQARKLIKSVEIIREDDGGKYREPVYVHVSQPAPEEGRTAGAGYHPVTTVVQRPDMYASALGELARRVRSATEAVDELKRAAAMSPGTDQERMARIAIAVQAMQTASAAVQALH